MATVDIQLLPEEAEFLSTSFPQFLKTNGTNFPVSGLAYDAATDEAAYWKFRASKYGSGNLTVALDWYADTASSGNVVWVVQMAALTPDADTQDVETDGITSANFVQDTHLGAVGQRLHRAIVTVSNLDNLAAEDWVVMRISRDADGTNATDDMAGDAILTMATVLYSDV